MTEENKASSPVPEKKSDDDLDDLLDNALQDFLKQPQPSPPVSDSATKNTTESSEKSKETKSSLPGSLNELLPDVLDEDAIMKLMSQCEQTVQSILNHDDGDEDGDMAEFSQQFSKDFQKIAEDTIKHLKEESGTPQNDISATLSETLKNLSENAESLQGNGGDLTDMFESLGLSGAGDMPTDFSAIFNNVMQMFLSKDVLYPSLKELATKYPDWLEENKSSLSKDDLTRYLKQHEIMTKVCTEMESATDSDSDEVKSKRFSVILELMQQMQEYGHPPKSLMGDSFDMPNWM